MKIYGVNIAEGSTVTNLVVASGPTFPELASEGELFYRNDGANEGMYVYDGEEWIQLGAASGAPAGSLISEIAGDLTGTVEIGTTSTLFLTPVGTSGTFVTVTTDETGRVISGTSSQAWSSITSTPTTLSGYGITDAQAADADLTAIAGLTGTSGLLKKTAANTWSLDTSTYLTGNQTITVSGDATGSGTTSIALTLANSGAAAGTYTKVTVDAKGRVTAATSLTAGDIPALSYLTGNQTITVSGDATGSGATSIPLTLANSGAAAGTYTKVTVDAKGRVTTATTLSAGDIPSLSGTYLTGNQTITVSGDATGSGSTSISLTLANSGVTAGIYGTASAVPTVTVDAKGRLTSATSTNIAIAASQITSGTLSDSIVASSNVTQHQASLTIAETQITDGSLLARVGSSETISGTWTFNNPVTVATPTSGSHAATKDYVDNTITGLDMKASVRVATTANITLSGTQTIDGVAVIAGDRVLVKDQNTASQNGIYVVAAGSWSRASDADNIPDGEVTSGMYAFVEEGTANADSGWVLSTNNPISLGTTTLTFVQFNGLGQITAGAGLTKTGNTINIAAVSADRVVVNTDSIDLATTGTAGTYAKVTTDAYGRVISGSALSSGDIPSLASTYVLKAGDTMTGALTGTNFHATAGTVTAPSISFSADTNTGIYRPSEDTIAFVEGGSEVMRITSSTYVGIGTTAPVAKFQVDLGAEGEYMRVGGDNAGGGRALRFSSTQSGVSPGALHTINAASGEGQIAFATASVERMRIDSVGRVAVGTSTYTSRFAVYGGDINLMANATYVRSATTAGTSVRMLGINASDVAYIGPIDSGPVATFFSVAPTSVISTFYTGGTERMRIDANGNVGIGTSTVAAKLHVLGATSRFGQITSGTAQLQIFNNNTELSTTTSFVLGLDSGSGINFGAAYAGVIWHQQAYPLLFATSNIERMRIDSNGNVSIGTTAAGGNRLTVSGTATFTTLRIGNGSTSSPSLSFLDDSATGIFKPTASTLGFSTNGGERMRISSAGNVGIGTSAPGYRLDVAGDTNIRGTVTATTASITSLLVGDGTAAAPSISFSADTNTGIYRPASDTIAFVEGGIEVMRIDSAGNVGIGTSTISAKLHVTGDALINGVTVGMGTNSGDGNVAVGTSALAANALGTDNTAVGRRALVTNAGGYRNSAVGSYSLEANTNGYGNSALGYQALLRNTTGNNNTAVGNGALLQNSSSSDNTAVGAIALYENTVGTANVAVGSAALNSNTGGSYLIAIGVDALRSNSTGANNIAQGHQALYSNTTGTTNIAIGNQALFFNTAGVGNSALGYQALYTNDVGNNNSAVGKFALLSNTSGSLNVAFGVQALYSNTSGNNNSAVGTNSLYSNTTGGNNSAFGYQAMQTNTTGTFNVAVGSGAMFSNTIGSGNVANGHQALYSNTTGADNVAVGRGALYSNTSSSYNTAIGRDSLLLNSTGTFNTAVGYHSMRVTTSATNNVAVGAYSLANNKSGYGNTALGANSLQSNTTGSNNIAVGHLSMYKNTEGSYNIAIGRSAVYENTTGYENIGVGWAAQQFNTIGYQNIAIGSRSLNSNTSGYRLTALGTDAMNKNTTGYNNSAIGYTALYNNTTGAENLGVGRGSLFANTSGSWNVAIGHNALFNSSGTNNFSIGAFSGADGLITITTESNQGVIGNNSTTNITAKVAITVPSDIRDKTEIAPVTLGLGFVTSVNPISYRFKKSRDSEEAVGRTILGFSAQELLPLQGNATIIDSSDQNLLKFNSQDLIAVLFKAVKEQQAIIDNLSARLDTLEGKK